MAGDEDEPVIAVEILNRLIQRGVVFRGFDVQLRANDRAGAGLLKLTKMFEGRFKRDKDGEPRERAVAGESFCHQLFRCLRTRQTIMMTTTKAIKRIVPLHPTHFTSKGRLWPNKKPSSVITTDQSSAPATL